MGRETNSQPDAKWDEARAASLVGKYILIGITHLEADGQTLIEQEQFHGVIERADAIKGILVSCRGNRLGKNYNLPPDLTSISNARPGEYRLRSTGEIVVNPDFTTSWISTAPLN
jgi:hypothetical protein